MNAQIEHLINENTRLKTILLEIVHEYGDRPTHIDGLFTSDRQPLAIKKAMVAVGLGCFGEIPA